jgi:hypothetical protein
VPRTGPNTRKGEQPPVMPIAATKHSPDGAKAFAEFFIKTIDWGYATTSSAYMRHYFDHRCAGCRQFADGFDVTLRKHDHYIGGRIMTQDSTVSGRPLAPRTDVTVISRFDILSIEKIDSSGHVLAADGAHSGERFETSLVWRADSWTVGQLGVDPR